MTVGDVTGGRRGLRQLRGMADPRDAWYPGLGSTDWGNVGAGAASGAATGAVAGPWGAAAGAVVGGASAALAQGPSTGELVGRGYGGRLRKFEEELGLARGKGAKERPFSFEQAVDWAIQQGIPHAKIQAVIARYPEAIGAKALLGMAAFSGMQAGPPAVAGIGGGPSLAILGSLALMGLVLSRKR